MSDGASKGPKFEIPDLELEPAVSKRPAPVSARAPLARAPHRPSPAQFGGEISLDGDNDGDDDDFELIPTGSSGDFAFDARAPERPRIESAAWPSGRARPADQLPIDPAEVQLVADYGPAPKSALLAPAYAYRVLARRAPLKRALALCHADLSGAELERDQALMQLSSELRPTLEASDGFRRALEPIREIERLASERGAALSAADSGYKQQMAGFDAELDKLRAAQLSAQALSTERATLASSTESELRRVEAKHQRVQIEIRGVLDVARKALGPAGGDIPAAQAAQLAELQAREKALEPELSAARSKHASADAALDDANADVRRQQSQIRLLERQKQSAGSSLEKQLSARVAGVSEAEKQRRDALAELGRAVLAARGAVPVAEPTLDALRAHDRKVEALAVKLETHVRALDSHEHERVRQGVIVVLSALGVVVLSICLKAML